MTDWDEWLSRAQFAYNNSFYESIHDTPFHLVLGRHPPTSLDASSKVKRPSKAAAFVEKIKTYTDRARTLLIASQ
jgi:hypothetical protein